MDKYFTLLDEAYSKGIKIKENRCFKSNADAIINGNVIGLSKNLETTTEKQCALAEELAHYDFNVGNILDQSDTRSRQQEYRARKRIVFRFIKLDDFISAFENHIANFHELAEFFNVTEKFLTEALHIYKQHYGPYTTHKNYLISFDPLYICKKFEID